MSLSVIGFGVGRTGTYSLKLALEQLGFGPCHHMYEVNIRSGEVLERWKAAARGEADLLDLYAGYRAAVDWPTAAFCPELSAAFPDAKFLLGFRDPEKWYRSYSSTIAMLFEPGRIPPDLVPFLGMLEPILRKTGFRVPPDKDETIAAYHRHAAMVKATIPPDRLLVFDVAQGWAPLCDFLGVAEPAAPFPRTNSTEAFWQSAKDETGATPQQA